MLQSEFMVFLQCKIFIFTLFFVSYSYAVRATLYTLCRNSDLYDILETIVNYELRFNSKYHYDWVFLNDEPFSDEFRRFVSRYVSGNAHFGQVDESHWSIPPDIDQIHMQDQIAKALRDADGAYPYADSISYRNMCRFESGFFYKHHLFDNYDYFWRVEPGVSLLCDINYDIFELMQNEQYDYGFTISALEYPKTIPSLFAALKDVLRERNELDLLLSNKNYSKFIYDTNRDDYTLCHFWTNFEIGNVNLFRSDNYQALFHALDSHPSKGFYYERWGDAPVRTLILSLILDQNKIKWFDEIGYFHAPYSQCPRDSAIRLELKCTCDPSYDITDKWFSCNSWFNQHQINTSAR